MQLLGEAQSASVVDVGCGECALLKSALMDPALPTLAHALGVDVSPTGLTRGGKNVATALIQRAECADLAACGVPSVRLYSVCSALTHPMMHPVSIAVWVLSGGARCC